MDDLKSILSMLANEEELARKAKEKEEELLQKAREKEELEAKEKALIKKERLKQIEKHMADAHASIGEAEKLADEFGVTLDFSLAYGMGGTYYPTVADDQETDEDNWWGSRTGWVSSSENC